MLRSLRRRPLALAPPLLRRRLHDGGIWGYQTPREFAVPDFTPEELANRSRNASLLRLVESYRKHGHRAALLDPLDLAERPNVPALDPRRYGFPLKHKLRQEFVSETKPQEAIAGEEERFDVTGILDFPKAEQGKMKTMDEIAARLADVYCGGVAYEFMHLPSKHERRFLETLLEQSHAAPLPPTEQLAHHALLAKSESSDRFLAKRFPSVKRYGLEGAEGMMVAVAKVLSEASEVGVEEVVIGMPHRGRLNLLTQLLDLDPRVVFRKMRGLPTLPSSVPASEFSDDVLSHLFGTFPYSPPSSLSSSAAKSVSVHVLPNPSHLETVTPVALGFARGLQVPLAAVEAEKKGERYELGEQVLSLSIHGDAAFGGQGVVAETLNMSALPHFTAGGTIHLVVNNQLGYTTVASAGRSSFYATDLAKSVAAPIIHVNGDKIDDIARAMKLALAYQRKFKKDVVVDLIVYRRHGHNELDEPGFTQPLISVAHFYEQHLVANAVLTPAAASSLRASHLSSLDAALAAAESFEVPELDRPRDWDAMRWPEQGEWEEQPDTGVEGEVLKDVGRRSVEVPEGLTIHPRLLKMHITKRLQSLDRGDGIDFATAEALAFGTLMLDGKHVRLCGQDSGRGTFSQRHAILADQTSEAAVVPLQSLTTRPTSSSSAVSGPGTIDSSAAITKSGTFEIVGSPLSEYAVLSFEQGIAYASPHVLPLWEGQFGDFHNTAQVVVDTYLGSGEGNARIERFLQLTNEPLRRQPFVPNLHVVNVTTAGNYFHMLRRQMKREYRKPLAVATPKGLLRLPAASSNLADLAKGTSFQPVLSEQIDEPSMVERVVILSGKLYYDFVKQRKERGLEGRIVFIRIEEISPFPYAALESALSTFTSASSFVWAQDEPENAGSYLFALPRLQQILPDGTKLEYAGRPAMATVAPGVKKYFVVQQSAIEAKVFEGL
ncbi:putative 2-oxoglutarate dehydrogenase E1 component DHKTD1, mitochondrial [Rhodosporidiobolus nylandii]